MKRFLKVLFLLLLIPLLIYCGDVYGDGAYRSGCSAGFSNCTFQGNSVFLGPVTLANPCVSGYARMGGTNLCYITTQSSSPSNVTTSCGIWDLTLSSNGGIPATAKSVKMIFLMEADAGSAAGIIQTSVSYYSNSGCTVGIPGALRSFMNVWTSNVSVGQAVYDHYEAIDIPLSSGTTIYIKKTDVITATGAVAVAQFSGIVSYTD